MESRLVELVLETKLGEAVKTGGRIGNRLGWMMYIDVYVICDMWSKSQLLFQKVASRAI